MSELTEALRLSAALPQLYQQEIERLSQACTRVPLSTISRVADAMEKMDKLGGHRAFLKAYGIEFPNNRLDYKWQEKGTLSAEHTISIDEKTGCTDHFVKAWINIL
ncbi:MAG TPA: hypothetical protein VFI60_05575 [Candidatus Acidoferrum sp.]|nr:hypothetical protein [Candidatus Acidoferrum sp.]